MDISNSRVLKTMQQMQEEHIDKWGAASPPVAFSIRDVSGSVFQNDLNKEVPSPILTLLVSNEIIDLVKMGLLKKIKDPYNYAHYTCAKKLEFFVLT